MRILVIGAEGLGAKVIKQLSKIDGVEILVADGKERPLAVEENVIGRVDVVAHVTAMNFEEVIENVKPDLVVLARTVQDWDKAETPMGSEYVAGMEHELTKFEVAVLPVDGRVLGPH